MYLSSLHLRSAPGLRDGLELEGLEPGFVILYGPNASGKSTLGRTLQGILWPDRAPPGIDAHSTWHLDEDGPPREAHLVFGRTVWTDDRPTPPAALADASQLTLQDLLQADASSDAAIARTIQTQLDGGYDLQAVELPADPRVRPLPSVRNPWRQASQALQQHLDATDALKADEERLAGLKQEAEQAAGAPGRLELVHKAQRRLEIQGELEELRSHLEVLPDAAATLPEDARSRAQELVEAVDERTAELEERRAEVRATTATVEALRFPAERPSSTVAGALVEQADDLVASARELARADQDVAALTRQVRELATQVWAGEDRADLPDRGTLEAFTSALDALRQAQARLEALPAVPGVDGDPLDPRREQALHDARSLLMQWLTTPREVVLAPEVTPNRVLSGVLIGVGVLLLLIGLGLAVAVSPWAGLPLAALGAGGIGAGLGIWLGPRLATSSAPAPASGPEALQERYLDGDHPPVDEWTAEGVRHALDRIAARLREGRQAAEQADRAERLEARHRKARQEVEQRERALRQAVEELGLQADLPALALATQAQRIEGLATARGELAEAKGRREALREAHQGLQGRLQETLGALALDDLPPLEDATAIKKAATAVRDRLARLEQADDDLAAQQREAERAREHLESATDKRDAFLAKCGVSLDDLDDLQALTEQRAAWQELTQRKRDLEGELGRLDHDLPEGFPATREELQAERARLDDLKERHSEIQSEIADIENRIEQATKGRTIQETLAEKHAAADVLAADRDEQLEAHAGRALLEWVREQRSHDHAPELLDRARRWFLEFTHHRYELLVDGASAFRALDTLTGRHQSLSELSDGTRIQLLLAARLAFVEHSEGEVPLPLFLDEVLSTTDDDRFDVVARAILELARTGRQVFYATADAGEVQVWRRITDAMGLPDPQVVNLGETVAAQHWEPPPELPGGIDDLPPTEGRDAIAWCAEAGLPRPTLQDDATLWPLALVLHDHLPQAAEAARQGLRVAGQLRLEGAGVALPLPDEALELATARAAALDAALAALRIGRGKPVTWAQVEASGAVTSTFEERVKKRLLEHGDDPEAFCEAVANVKGFYKSKARQLRTHLEQEGVLDPRDPLPTSEVVSRAQRASRGALEAGVLTLREVEELVEFAQQVVGVGA